jgi:glycosyltransferase involved in cell wall biosynthesis
MKVVFSHPTGNANVKAAANSLMEANLLSDFRTSIASFRGDFLDRLGAISALAEIRRRRFDSILKPVTHKWPWLETGRLVATKAGVKRLTKHETGLFSIDAVYRSFDKHVASKLKQLSKQGIGAIYAYEDAAAFSFREGKNWGLKCYYDLPIGYWRAARQFLEAEQERFPEWKTTLTGFSDSEAKLNRKDEELILADRIFVASEFTANTLQSFPGNLATIKVIPYGFPPVFARDYRNLSTKTPLKLLFVGGLSQRKGIANLFAAVEKIGTQVQLTVVGQKPSVKCTALDKALVQHTWIPTLPHPDILKLMRQQDVLIFPSLFEGFGLVITEAMSQGTPVITTERTAGPDLIVNDENGWLVEAGSTSALVNAIEHLLKKPNIVSDAGKAAMETARRRPWKKYGSELVQAIIEDK